MKLKALVIAAVIAGGVLVGGPSAHADHAHAELRNGSPCMIRQSGVYPLPPDFPDPTWNPSPYAATTTNYKVQLDQAGQPKRVTCVFQVNPIVSERTEYRYECTYMDVDTQVWAMDFSAILTVLPNGRATLVCDDFWRPGLPL